MLSYLMVFIGKTKSMRPPTLMFSWEIYKFFNDTHRENCILLNLVQEFIEIKAWLFLTFFLCLHNQLISIHSIAAY